MAMLLRRGVALASLRKRIVQHVRCGSSAVERAAAFSPGQTLHGYTVTQVTPVPELYLTAVSLTHNNTGAQHLHVARDDSDNAFGVAFRTTPRDSTGVPHVLEHTALCGSARFPVRDPFFKMLNRSLATFMNAFTANDWTMYPFSTQNRQDFQNLLSIYLDAAFFPQLREQDFRQEGWRLEHEKVDDATSPIIFKGIVFNEMKGVFSDSQQVFTEQMRCLLLPSHTYGVCSGGDPRHIPSLSVTQLRHFHRSHYHPSNTRFYTYGDMPLDGHLQEINARALETFGSIDPGTAVPLERRWTQPRDAEMTCASNPLASDVSKQTTCAVSYLLADVTDTFESFVLSFVSSLLTHGEAAPFYRALIEPNIGSDFAPGLGYDGNTRQASFSVGLEGIHPDDITKVKDIIEATFDKVIKAGFDEQRVEMLLHQIEIGQRHMYNHFGLYLGVNLISAWTHGAPVSELLQTNVAVARFKACIKAKPTFLQDKVKQYFKDNTHRVTLVMRPDERYEELRQEEEQTQLSALVNALSEADKKDIYEQGLAMVEQQGAAEDVSCLPSLDVTDIARTGPRITLHGTTSAGGVPVQVSEQPTNGVTYFRCVSNMRDLNVALKPYVPLFCSVVTKMGAGTLDYRQFSEQVELRTGRFEASVHIADHHTLPDAYEEGVLFSSFCLDRNVAAMFHLWAEVFQRLDLSDVDRLQTLTVMSAAELAQGLSGAGHSFAMCHSASSLSAAAALREALTGMAQVNLMKIVATTKDLSPVLARLRDIASHLLNRRNMRVLLTATPEAAAGAGQHTERLLVGLDGEAAADGHPTTSVQDFQPREARTHFLLPFQVNYMSRSVRTTPYSHKHYASLRVLARLMTNKYLHREIREKGGAYGGGAAAAPGSLSFYSYRDPNALRTLEAFDGAVAWAMAGSFTQQDVDEAKLAIFQKEDAPVPPGDRGLRCFLTAVGDVARDQHRHELFAVDREGILHAAHSYLSKAERTSSVSFLGPENQATANTPQWTVEKQ